MEHKFDKIVSNPQILGGKPCIAGTLISVEIILEWIASGTTITGFNIEDVKELSFFGKSDEFLFSYATEQALNI